MDSESGLIYLRNRYYDTATGTFITEDPIRDGLNWYAYCAGNPIMFMDPWGLAYRALRELVESLGGTVNSWENTTKTATVTVGNQKGVFSAISYEEKEKYPNLTTPYILNDRMYVDEIDFYNQLGIITYDYSANNIDGRVIIVSNNDTSNVYIGQNDYLVYDQRQNNHPNMQVRNSYRADGMAIYVIIDILLQFEQKSPSRWYRNSISLQNEWTWHNLAYSLGIERERTGHVDFDNCDWLNYPRTNPLPPSSKDHTYCIN